MKRFFNYRYWIKFSGRISQSEFIIRWLIISIIIQIVIKGATLTKEGNYLEGDNGKFFIIPAVIFYVLILAATVSTIKLRYNDLPKSRVGFLFWWWRCVFDVGDTFNNKHGEPPQHLDWTKW